MPLNNLQEANSTTTKNISLFTIDEILAENFFAPIVPILYQFVLAPIAILGFLFCTITALVFFKKRFNTPDYFYFRVLSVFNLIIMLLSVPYSFCYTPKYFLHMDNYKASLYQCFYLSSTFLIYHYVNVVGALILIERIKIFSPFLKTKFTISPKKICLLSFIACFLIDFFFVFFYVPFFGGDYFYFDIGSNSLKSNSFYYVFSSNIARSRVGSVFNLIMFINKNFILMLAVVVLNIISVVKIQLYLHARNKKFSLNKEFQKNATETKRDSKDLNNILMVIVLGVITIISRSIEIVTVVYFLFVQSNEITIVWGAVCDTTNTLESFLSIFVYYAFDKNFKKEFWQMFKKINIRN